MSNAALRLVAAASRWVWYTVPVGQRPVWACEAEDAMVAVCQRAFARAGWSGLIRASLAELLDHVRTAARLRFGHTMAITGGPSPFTPQKRGISMLSRLLQDIRLGVRTLWAVRAQSAIAIATLALGIGINTAIFSVLDSLLFRPQPFAQADRMVEVWNFAEESRVSFPRFNRTLYNAWRDQTDIFDRVAGYESETVIVSGSRGSQSVPGAFVTPEMLSILGVAPTSGRLFTEGDGREGTDAQVVISERFWRDVLGSPDPVVGTTIVLNDRPHAVIGMMPETFYFPSRPQQVWLPIDINDPPQAKANMMLTAFGRLAPGMTFERASELVSDRGVRLREASGGGDGIGALLTPRGDIGDGSVRQSLIVLGGAVLFLLLIVAANLANLSLSRTLARGRDFAVRSALGASRADLIRETVVENLLIGACGVAGGLSLALFFIRTTGAFLPDDMLFRSLNQIDLDGRAFLFTLGAGLFSSLLFGLPPAIMGSRPNVLGVLRSESRSTTASASSRRLRAALVVGEVTVAIVLLVGAALMTRSFMKLQSIERGFDSAGLVAINIGYPAGPYADARMQDRFADDALAELRRLPGVTQATVGASPPETDRIFFASIEIADNPGEASDQMIVPVYRVWPNYFESLHLPLVDGRPFADDEPKNSRVVSAGFAEKFWPGESAVGKRFRTGGSKEWLTVVGVSTEVRQLALDDAAVSYEWFSPLRVPPGEPSVMTAKPGQSVIEYRTLLARADDPLAVFASLKEAIHTVDPRIVVGKADIVDNLFSEAIARPRILFVLLLVFSGVGLILAAAGIYGVLSYLVNQRLREIGIRLALGASPEGVFRLVVRNGLVFTGAGLVLGLTLSFFLVRVMQSILYEVEPSDPVAIASVSGLLLLTACFACWRPARRAMRVDPVRLLREQ